MHYLVAVVHLLKFNLQVILVAQWSLKAAQDPWKSLELQVGVADVLG